MTPTPANSPATGSEFGDAEQSILNDILNAHRPLEGALLPILHAVQEAFGHIPPAALPIIARDQQISRAEAYGVMSFYHDFRDRPAGHTILKICRAEACQAMGAEALGDHAREVLGVDWHGTTADGKITLMPVFCLGLCACGPSLMADGKLVGRVDAARLDAIIAEANA